MNEENKKTKMEAVRLPKACGMHYGYCCCDCVYMSSSNEQDGKYWCGKYRMYEDPAHDACSKLKKKQ